MEQQRLHQEERVRRALERAKADPKKKVIAHFYVFGLVVFTSAFFSLLTMCLPFYFLYPLFSLSFCLVICFAF